MKRSNAFTLIELLAVILILGVIALIAIPTVSKIIKESKKGAFKSSVQNLINVIETDCQLRKMDGNEIVLVYTFTNGSVDNKLNVKGALPKNGTITVDNNCNIKVNITDGTYIATKPADSGIVTIKESGSSFYTCVRATNLHKEECGYTMEFLIDMFLGLGYSIESAESLATDMFELGNCSGTGYYASGSKGTTTITYGQIGTKGMLTSGDAFDCDVNDDGVFDEDTERFYYVSDYYNTSTKEFESDKATLIYYNNITKGFPDNTSSSKIAYYDDDDASGNYTGPVTASTNMPLKLQWSNHNLITGTRAIIAEDGKNSIDEGYLPPVFLDYSNYAARLLTTQELSAGCNNMLISENSRKLEVCNYLLENTIYSSFSIENYGYWLETPFSLNSYTAWLVDASGRGLRSYFSSDSVSVGARPAITLLKSNISY